jgi:exopolyphosphatase/guanosine-5'-triphosphate,3'-diphosphate pyrophosphatase
MKVRQTSNGDFPADGVCNSAHQPLALGPSPSASPNCQGSLISPAAPSAKAPQARIPARAAQHARRADHIYAALDLGTNNCRLLVARPSRRNFHVIDAFSRIIRLGEGVVQTGVLSEAAIGRALDALSVCAEKMARRGVTRSRLIATEACRIAINGPEFLERARQRTGLSLEIVSREAEARLAVAGCSSLVDRRAHGALIFDIGGGSSELIWLNLNGIRSPERPHGSDRIDYQSCVAAWTSLRLGVVTLSEHFGGKFVDAACYDAMVAYVLDHLQPFERQHAISEKLRHMDVHLLGTSGTVTTVAGIHMGLKAYDRNRVDGCWLLTDDVRVVSQRLLAKGYEARIAEPCVGRDRADLVLAGCAILEAIMRTWPCPRLRVADRGLREGMLLCLMSEDGQFRSRRSRRHRPGV